MGKLHRFTRIGDGAPTETDALELPHDGRVDLLVIALDSDGAEAGDSPPYGKLVVSYSEDGRHWSSPVLLTSGGQPVYSYTSASPAPENSAPFKYWFRLDTPLGVFMKLALSASDPSSGKLDMTAHLPGVDG